MPILSIVSGPEKGKKINLSRTEPAVFGRDAGCTAQLTDILSSRRHFQVLFENGSFHVQDLGSSNGTLLNDEKVDKSPLDEGDEIRVGETRLLFSVPAAEKTARPAGAAKNRNDPLIDTTLGGYYIEEFIGRGGMGAVYKTKQISLNRTVALKILSRRLTSDKKFIDMFIKEARAAGSLNHPNIVQVYDVGEEGGTHFFSMELMTLGSVGDSLKKLGRLSVAKALEVAIHIAKALEYAEKKNLVHCDIKPDNLMISEDGTVKLGDLGLSKNVQRDEGETDSDVVFGTPHFIAPEQAQRQKVDHRADLYSLGASLYLMLSGRTPYTGDTGREIALKHVREPLKPVKVVLPEVPDRINAIVTKMMAKDPKDRYPSATRLLDELRKANIEINPAAAYTDGFPGIPLSKAQPGPGRLFIFVGAVALLLLLGLLAALGVFSSDGVSADNPSPGPVAPGPTPGPSTADKDAEARRRLEEEKRRIEEDKRQLREDQARNAYSAAVSWEEKNGLTHPKTLEKYALVARKYPNTVFGKKAEKRRTEIAEKNAAWHKREKDAASALEAIEGKANLLMKDWYFQKALDCFAEFDMSRFSGTEAAGKIKSRRQFVRNKASSSYAQIASEASALATAGDFDRARALLRRVIERFGMTTFTAKAQKALRKIESDVSRIQKSKIEAIQKADQALFEETAARCQKEVRAFRFEDARESARAILPHTPTGQEKLKTEEFAKKTLLLLKDIVNITRLFRQTLPAVNARSGKVMLTISKVSPTKRARILTADEKGLKIKLGPGKTGVEWADLTVEEFYKLASAVLPRNPQSHLLLAVYAMFFGGDLVAHVRSHLEEALKANITAIRVEAQEYRDRFYSGSSPAGRQIEGEAKALFEEFKVLYDRASREADPDRAVALLEEARAKLQELRDKYGHTRFVRDLEKE
jgi:hypothetical protein